jgi:chromosome segregation ATPase
MDTEVLETNEIIVPNELLDYLKDDEKALETLNKKISDISSKEEELTKEVEAKSQEIEDRLEEFKKALEKEKEEQAKIYGDRATKLFEEKEKIESLKSEQESKKQSYIASLIKINESFESKIDSIKSAIDIAPDNDSLKKALEEEQAKLKEELTKESEDRKTEIDKVLESVGEKEVELPKVTEIPVEEPVISKIEETHDDNEVVDHESRKDVIDEIYGSEEVMEGHVFPYLNGLLGE